MAGYPVDIGTVANDGTGDELRDAFGNINTVTTVIQSRSYVSPSTSTTANTDSAVFVDTDLIVSITTRSATSKLRVRFNAAFGTTSATQEGVKGHIQKNVDSAGYVNILFGNQTVNFLDTKEPSSKLLTWPISSGTQIDSPGLGSVILFKITFAPDVNGQDVEYRDDEGINMITVDEILET